MSKLEQRFRAACRSLVKDINGGCDSGVELIGIIELRNGEAAQIHVSVISDENEFLDADGPTGCADDLMVTAGDLREAQPTPTALRGGWTASPME